MGKIIGVVPQGLLSQGLCLGDFVTASCYNYVFFLISFYAFGIYGTLLEKGGDFQHFGQ